MLTRSTLLSSTTSTFAYALWTKISGDGTNRAGDFGRGLPGPRAAGCWHRESVVAEAIVRLESLALGRAREGEQRRLSAAVAVCRFARQVGNLPDTRMRSSSGDCPGRFADRGDIETIRDKFAKFASVQPECGPAVVAPMRRSS